MLLAAAGQDPREPARTSVRLDRAFSLAAHPDGRVIAAVALDDHGAVTTLERANDGRLGLVGRLEAPGTSGLCRVRVAADAARLLIAGYESGTLTTVPIDAAGRPTGEARTIAFEGSGPDPERQSRPFAHDALDVDEVVLVADLGTDLVRRVVDGRHGLRELEPIRCPPGSGPRHLAAVGPGLVAASGELDSSLILIRVGPDGGEVVDTIPATSVPTADRNYPSSVVGDPARAIVYIANRGADTIMTARVDGERLVTIGERPSGGVRPEHLALADDRLIVAHSVDGAVAALPIVDGLPGAPVVIATVPGAVWVEPLPQRHASKPATAR